MFVLLFIYVCMLFIYVCMHGSQKNIDVCVKPLDRIASVIQLVKLMELEQSFVHLYMYYMMIYMDLICRNLIHVSLVF